MRCRSSVKTTASTLICIYSLATLFNTRYTQCNAGWVDPDTPEKYLSIQSNFPEDTREYELVSISTRCFALILISYIICSHLMSYFCTLRFSPTSLNRMVVRLKMDPIPDGLLLIRMIVSRTFVFVLYSLFEHILCSITHFLLIAMITFKHQTQMRHYISTVPKTLKQPTGC